MRKGESMMEIDETKKLVSKVFNSFFVYFKCNLNQSRIYTIWNWFQNWVDFLVENEEFEAAAKNVKNNRDNAQPGIQIVIQILWFHDPHNENFSLTIWPTV